jgi:hypothetical protein
MILQRGWQRSANVDAKRAAGTVVEFQDALEGFAAVWCEEDAWDLFDMNPIAGSGGRDESDAANCKVRIWPELKKQVRCFFSLIKALVRTWIWIVNGYSAKPRSESGFSVSGSETLIYCSVVDPDLI